MATTVMTVSSVVSGVIRVGDTIMAVENEAPLIFVEKTEDHINTLVEHIPFIEASHRMKQCQYH